MSRRAFPSFPTPKISCEGLTPHSGAATLLHPSPAAGAAGGTLRVGFGPWPCQIPKEPWELVVVEHRGEGTGALGKPLPRNGAETTLCDWDQDSSEQGYGIFNEYADYPWGQGGDKIKAGIVQRW